MKDQLGDDPIEPYSVHLRAIAAALDRVFNDGATGDDRKVGFVLMVFPFGSDTGRCNYISNGADPRDLVALFKEQIARFEDHQSKSKR